MKRELDNMEMIHDMYVGWYKSSLRMNSFLVGLLCVLTPFCAKVGIDSFREGDVLWVVVEMICVWVNIFNILHTVRNMIRERKDFKEENRLYELARADMLRFCEIEEAFGEELELDFEEEENE